jgi:hypothetical protein
MEFENQLKLGIGIYTPSEIAKILRLPYHKVLRWIDKYWDGELGKEYEPSRRIQLKYESSLLWNHQFSTSMLLHILFLVLHPSIYLST